MLLAEKIFDLETLVLVLHTFIVPSGVTTCIACSYSQPLAVTTIRIVNLQSFN